MKWHLQNIAFQDYCAAFQSLASLSFHKCMLCYNFNPAAWFLQYTGVLIVQAGQGLFVFYLGTHIKTSGEQTKSYISFMACGE
jgi:hypothetical protein